MARGDITIAAMVGAGAAPLALNALVYGVLISGVLALAILAASRSRHTVMPAGQAYASADWSPSSPLSDSVVSGQPEPNKPEPVSGRAGTR